MLCEIILDYPVDKSVLKSAVSGLCFCTHRIVKCHVADVDLIWDKIDNTTFNLLNESLQHIYQPLYGLCLISIISSASICFFMT